MNMIKNNNLKFLTLNLHTYQELDLNKYKNFEEFFSEYSSIIDVIVNVIINEDIDIICFQEAAQHKDMPVICYNNGIPIKQNNIIYEIVQRLNKGNCQKYNYTWDWSHYGWNVWEEGLGIISRFEIVKNESMYISEKYRDTEHIYSRKGVLAKLNIPGHGLVNVVTVHLNWWEQGFSSEIDNLVRWIDSESLEGEATIIAGDFNNEAGSEGYMYMKKAADKSERGFIDVHAFANPDAFHEATIRMDAFNNNARIDYILLSENSNMQIESCRIIFKDEDFGRVSDHMGVYAQFK